MIVEKIPVSCWSLQENEVCLIIDGQKRWIPVDYWQGRDDMPFCTVDGQRYAIGGCYAYPALPRHENPQNHPF